MRFALAALVALAEGCGCDSHCLDSIEWTVDFTPPSAALATATVTFCVNTSCASGAFDAGSTTAELSGAFFAQATLATSATDADVTVGASGGNGSHHDGDVVMIHIADSSGAELFGSSQTVSYSVVEDGCGGSSCREIALRTSP